MRAVLLSVLMALPIAASAECGWTDDGVMATALLDSHWQVTTTSGMVVAATGPSMRVDLVPQSRRFPLVFGPLLRRAAFDGREGSLRLVPAAQATDGVFRPGQHAMVIRFPDLDGTPCAGADLSALEVAADPEGPGGFRLLLRVATPGRLLGVLNVSAAAGPSGVGAGLYSVKAHPIP